MTASVAKKAAALAGAGATGAYRAADSAVTPVADATGKVLRRPTRIVNRSVGTFSQLAWTLLVTLLALSFMALVLRMAQQRPVQLNEALLFVPDTFRTFVNPFGDNPLRQTTKAVAAANK